MSPEAPPVKPVSTNSGIVLRRGRRWGSASASWAEMTLAYASPLRSVARARDLDLMLWGNFAQWEAPDGARIWGGPSDEIGGLPLEDIYRDGELVPGLALRWPLHQFIRVGPASGSIEIVVGRFFPRGNFYAERNGDLLIAPELKAFSSVRSFRSVRPFPRGHRLRIEERGGAIRFEPACEDPGEPDSYPPYEEACRECRVRIEQALDQTLESLREPFVLALSGGMDSSLLAYLLVRRGIRPVTYNVWFDCDRGEAPRDVTLARRVAGELDLELKEIRITTEMFRPIAAEAIYLGEWPEAYQLDNAIYHIPFLRELKRIGVRIRLTANGIDNAFAGYSHFERVSTGEDFRRLYFDLLSGAYTRHISSMNSFYGCQSVAPFRTTPLLKFGLGLPRSYLIETRNGAFAGKRIVRDAFRGEVPDFVLDQSKLLPGQVNDADKMTTELFGDLAERERVYEAVRQKLLDFPDLRRVPGWLVRAGLGRRMMKKRFREGERLLQSRMAPAESGPTSSN